MGMVTDFELRKININLYSANVENMVSY